MTSLLDSFPRSLTLFLLIAAGSLSATAQELVTFDSWKKRCLATPANRVLKGRMPTKKQLPLSDFGAVKSLAMSALKHYQKSSLADKTNWLGERPKENEFFAIDRSYYTRSRIPFQPFAQKVRIRPGSKVIFHGDFHGDIRSFITTLEWLNEKKLLDGFKLSSPDTYLVFLGDYGDRGSYGIEVLYTLMRLKLANPRQVLMARGNHEDFQLTSTYGFLREGQMKYGRAFDPLPLWRIYDFLPVVIYLGVDGDYVQCNHGGMEPGFDPKNLLSDSGEVRYQFLGELRQKTFAKKNSAWLRDASTAAREVANEKLADFRPESPTFPNPIGFMWNDFSLFEDDPALAFNPSRLAFNHGKASTDYLLRAASSDSAKLRAVFRAHQHTSVPSPAMNRIIASNGAFRHWQPRDSSKNSLSDKAALRKLIDQEPERSVPAGSVWTFNVSPDSVYGSGNEYTFDTIGILTTAEAFEDWRLKVVNVPVEVK